MSVTYVVLMLFCKTANNNENEKVILYSVMDTYVERVQMGQSWHGLLKKHNWLESMTVEILTLNILERWKTAVSVVQ